MNKPTGAKRTIKGVVFVCYRTGPMQSKWMSEGGRLTVRATLSLSGYFASIDGEAVRSASGKPKQFRTIENAMTAAVKARDLTPDPSPDTEA